MVLDVTNVSIGMGEVVKYSWQKGISIIVYSVNIKITLNII